MALPIPLILAAIKLIPQLRKSKTAKGNAGVGAIIVILNYFGVDMPVEVVTAFFVLLNIILRMITKQPLNEK